MRAGEWLPPVLLAAAFAVGAAYVIGGQHERSSIGKQCREVNAFYVGPSQFHCVRSLDATVEVSRNAGKKQRAQGSHEAFSAALKG